jgi:hypothetical protein
MTVTGTFIDANDAPRAVTRVIFTPESAPFPDPSGLVTAVPISVVTTTAGAISLVLEPGFYRVEVGLNRRDTFRIQVPDDAGTSDITSLVVGTLPIPVANFRTKNGWVQLRDPVSGLWHSLSIRLDGGYPMLSIGDGEL